MTYTLHQNILQSAKLLQQRLNDMKKTFQKELKTTTGKVNQDNQFNGGNGTTSSDSDNLNPNETSHLEQKISLDFAGASTSLNAFSSPKRTAPILNHSPISIESGDIDVRLSKVVDLEYSIEYQLIYSDGWFRHLYTFVLS